MALKNLNTKVTPATKFESEEETVAGLVTEATPGAVIGGVSLEEATGDTDVMEAPITNAAAAEDAVDAKAQATTTAIAMTKLHAVAAASKKFTKALDEKENVFDPAGLDFNTFPRVIVGLDGFSLDDGQDLGKEIQLEVMSFNSRFVASPGDDTDEAKAHVRYSLDGAVIDSKDEFNGTPVVEYIKYLKSLGYSGADRKEYLAIYGFLTHADGAEIDPAERDIVALQVPPQSRTLFDRHRMTEGVKIARNIVQPTDFLRCTQEKVGGVGGTKKFAQIKFASVR